MKQIAKVLQVSRSNLLDRCKGRTKARGPYVKAEDAFLLPLIRRFVDERPTYGYRRIAALVNRQLARQGRQSQAGAPDHAAGQSGSKAPYRPARGVRA